MADPANSPVPIALDYWHNPSLPKTVFNVEQARSILAEAGYTWDADGRLHYPLE